MPGPGRSNAVAMILDAKQTVPGRNPKLYAGLGDNDAYNIQLLNIYLKDWYSYDFATNQWKQERNLPDTGKSNAGSFAYEHIGFVTCGYDGEWKKNFFLYNTEDEDWTRYPDYRDSGRSLGAGFIHGNRGFYGSGFRGNSEELETFSWYNIDTNSIRLYPAYTPGDTFCAGSDITFSWASAINFNPWSKLVVQVSDKDGIFEWPITANSNMDTFDINGDTGTITATIPHKIPRGSQYKIRVLSSSPFYISRFTDTFFVKENPKFKYHPKTHPLIDTVCLNADYFIPSEVTGDKSIKGYFDYWWIKNNIATGDTGDTLTFTQIQFADEGKYRLVAQGDCFADTSETFDISVENIPAPSISEDLSYPGMIGDTLFLCEYDTNTFYVNASGKKISYQWYHDGFRLYTRDTIEGLGGPVIKNASLTLADSGVYELRVVESCGSYTESDSILVTMRQIPRITLDPKNIEPAVLEGTTVDFEVAATGYDLSFQWRKDATLLSNGPRITGADEKKLTITSLISSDVAFYSCIVSGGCPGFADTSNLAIIDLNASPTIIKEPNDTLEVCEGAGNVITIVAAGTNLRYNWTKQNGDPLTPAANFQGINTRVLTIIDAQLNMSGPIICTVDNSAGADAISQVAYLRVKPKPAKPNLDQIGNILQSDVTCDTYIWFYNGVWKGQYTTKSIKPTEEGDYTLRVLCEGCASEISEPYYFRTISLVSVQSNDLDMYPNPAQGKVMLDLPGINAGNPATVNIYDLTGKLVKTITDVDSDSYEVDLQNLSKGMYVVQVSSA